MTHEQFEWLKKELRWQAQLLYRLIQLEEIGIELDRRIIGDLESEPQLKQIRIQFGGIMPLGPVTLNVGQSATATVVGFDQLGAPWTGPIPTPTFSVDNPAIASSTPSADGQSAVVLGVSEGVANESASLTTAEGLALSTSETVTVSAPPPPPPPTPVLSSIKLNFAV